MHTYISYVGLIERSAYQEKESMIKSIITAISCNGRKLTALFLGDGSGACLL